MKVAKSLLIIILFINCASNIPKLLPEEIENAPVFMTLEITNRFKDPDTKEFQRFKVYVKVFERNIVDRPPITNQVAFYYIVAGKIELVKFYFMTVDDDYIVNIAEKIVQDSHWFVDNYRIKRKS